MFSLIVIFTLRHPVLKLRISNKELDISAFNKVKTFHLRILYHAKSYLIIYTYINTAITVYHLSLCSRCDLYDDHAITRGRYVTRHKQNTVLGPRRLGTTCMRGDLSHILNLRNLHRVINLLHSWNFRCFKAFIHL